MRSYYYGIKTNNIKNIDISFLNERIILFCGPSGSGKSSVAVDTIHRISEDELNQLMNSKDGISTYSISDYRNILPSICLQQENYNTNPRSTIATYFNIDTYFKELFSIRNSVSQRFFQFNTQLAACDKCSGTGISLNPDPLKIIDYSSKISEIPFKNWKSTKSEYYYNILMRYCAENKINPDMHFKDLKEHEQIILLNSESEGKYKIKYISNGRKHTKTSKYKGPIRELYEEIIKNNLPSSKKKYFSEDICDKCNGTRFSDDILKYQLYDKNIGELYLMKFDLLLDWINRHKEIWNKISNEKRAFHRIIQFIKSALVLNLDYLNFNRSIPTLSGGELQRLRLAKAQNSQFTNFLYVLDEPTSGLHPSEWEIISKLIYSLKNMGNTILLIEHNTFLKKIADEIIFLGPEGGERGGEIVKETHIGNKATDDIRYKFFKSKTFVNIKNASFNNVKNISIKLPENSLIGVCGVSGSGKSSFLYGILPKYLNNITYLNQSPIRGNYYSVVATAIGVFANIQELYSKINKVSKEYFTYMSKGKGQCKICMGKGFIKEDSSFIKTEIVCPECEGKRFSKASLNYKYNGLNIYEFLSMSVENVINEIPKNYKKITKVLNLINSIGMGYLNLFQNTSTLSGGESQRIKLIRGIFQYSTKKTYLLDEPFRGVDDNNIKKAMIALYDLVEKGYTIYIAEHNLFVINYCSYIIEFGPKSGDNGGNIIYFGEKKDIVNSKNSIICKYLSN